MLQNKLNCTCVEIDCQKVLGVEAAWYFRKRMRDLLPNRQINVFHYEDGKEGLDRLIEFSDYIAFSIPELRIVKPKTFRQDAYNLVQYTKNKKPEIDIHLLGCTDFRMLAENKCCTSADSTSWLQGVKYGSISDGSTKNHVNNFDAKLRKERFEAVHEVLKQRGVVLKEKTMQYSTAASISATICKMRYTQVAGSQD